MTTPTRPACLELVLAFLGAPEAAKLRSYIEALEARAALAQPEPIRDRIAQAEAAIEASMERIRAIAAPARTALAQPEPASQALADLVWPDPVWSDPTTITPRGMAINGRMYRLTPMDEPEPVGATPQCVADGCLDEAARQEPGSPMQQLLLEAGWLLTRWRRPTPQPIPVSERLPEAGDCDAEGQIWAWYCDDPDVEYEGNFWTPLYLRLVTASHNVTHWLPASALPIPQHPQPDPTA